MHIKESLRMTVRGDLLFKDFVKKEEDLKCKWYIAYKWLPEEYIKLHNKLENEVSTESSDFKIRKIDDPRIPLMRPVPQTTTQEIGWLSGKREFLLDKYGKDNVMQPEPMDKDILGV